MDGNGCVYFVEIFEVEQLLLFFLELLLVLGVCFGLSNGVVEVVVNGGVLFYQFQWSNGVNIIVGELNGLLVGSYLVMVIDDDECNSMFSFVIEGVSLLVIFVLE